jgi:hypothetical protein
VRPAADNSTKPNTIGDEAMARITVPPTTEEMSKLTDDELSSLASAVVKEQHERSGADGRLARTQAATAARLAAQANDPEARRRQTAAATEARKRNAAKRTTAKRRRSNSNE